LDVSSNSMDINSYVAPVKIAFCAAENKWNKNPVPGHLIRKISARKQEEKLHPLLIPWQQNHIIHLKNTTQTVVHLTPHLTESIIFTLEKTNTWLF
jgi:hypothetical protein